ncbi:MAG TPA: hypothetical protein VFH26_04490 [Gemmatimonadales bacterium]|nr:hypothetical protein [Gemmatimonadales bacterium]
MTPGERELPEPRAPPMEQQRRQGAEAPQGAWELPAQPVPTARNR